MISQKASELPTSEIRILSLASIGGALEFYDFVIFVFFATVIGKLFFAASLPDWVRQVQTFGIFAAGYLARPIGGVVMAHFGDTRGRKRMFTLSVLLMAIPTLLIGLLPTYQSIGVAAPMLLLLMRILQGVAIGGEAPGAWVFVAGHARRGKVGFAVGLLGLLHPALGLVHDAQVVVAVGQVGSIVGDVGVSAGQRLQVSVTGLCRELLRLFEELLEASGTLVRHHFQRTLLRAARDHIERSRE